MNWRTPAEYKPPTPAEVFGIVNRSGLRVTRPDRLADLLRPGGEYDVRDIVAAWMRLCGISDDSIQWRELYAPWLNGFWKHTDGKSTPFLSWKINPAYRHMRIPYALEAVRHDYAFYRGYVVRQRPNGTEEAVRGWRGLLAANRNFYEDAVALGSSIPAIARVEQVTLNIWPGTLWSWYRGDRLRRKWPGYGTEWFIERLEPGTYVRLADPVVITTRMP